MYEHLLLAAAIILGLTLLRLLRRPSGAPTLYTLLIAGELGAALVGMSEGGRAWGVAAIAMAALTVVLPALAEVIARRLFARGAVPLAVRVAGLRVLLMPGAGLGRHQEILRGLALLHARGVDAALAHFRRLLHETEDPQEALVIHEQIVSMLFFAQRWSEAIRHFEGQFHLGHAAMRPALALGLLRAYGEAGELERAAGLLRALEEGPLGVDPAAAELLGQARLTFLAYTGQAELVDEAAAAGRRGALGLSPANTALFHGIALARAGEAERAVVELERALALAGPRDERVAAASRSALARVGEAAGPLAPELRRYAAAVGERLRGALAAATPPRRRGALVVTPLLAAAMIAGFAAVAAVGGGGHGLLAVGAYAPALAAAGAWGRLFTAPFVHVDLIGLVIDVYAIRLGGHIVERVLGRARLAVIALAGGAAGTWASGLGDPMAMTLIGGAPALTGAVLVAALWTVAALRPPAITLRARRSLMLTLLLLLFAQLLASLPAAAGLWVSPAGLGIAALCGTLLAAPRRGPRWLDWAFVALAVGLGGLAAVGAAQVRGEDVEAFLASRRAEAVAVGGVRLSPPLGFVRQEAGPAPGPGALPGYAGLRDGVALRGGAQVQVVVVDAVGLAAEAPAIFALDPGLAREASIREEVAPPAIAAALAAAPGRWRAYALVRDGAVVAAAVERALPGERARVLLVAAPAQALAGAPDLYARVLADAAPEEGEAEAVGAGGAEGDGAGDDGAGAAR